MEENVAKTIRELKIGDKVEVVNQSGHIAYSEVMMFADFKPNALHVLHVVIETKKPAKRLTLTPMHLIFTVENNNTGTQFKAKRAASVSLGEYVLVSQDGRLLPSRVEKVSTIEVNGTVAPITVEGNIVVDGVLASCYAVIQDHNIAHLAFGPLRFLHNYVPSLRNKDSPINSGMHWYADMLMGLNGLLRAVDLS